MFNKITKIHITQKNSLYNTNISEQHKLQSSDATVMN